MRPSLRAGVEGPAVRTVSVEAVLDAVVCGCGCLCLLMVWDGIGWGTASVFALALMAVVLVRVLDLPRPPAVLSLGGVVLLLVLVLSRVSRRYMAEPFLEAVLLLFLFRVLDRKSSRDYVQIALLTLVALVVYALLSVEKLFLLAALGTGYCASLILMLAAWQRREADARLSLADAGRLLRRALGIFAMMLPLCLALFFLAPRVRNPILRPLAGGGAVASTGFSERLRLGEVGTIQGSDRLSFRAETEELPPDRLYWRGAVLSYFTGVGWEVDLRARGEGWGHPDANTPQVRQKIILEPGRHRWLFALDRPLATRGGGATGLGNGTFWRHGTGEALRYEAVSVLSPLPGTLSDSAESVFLELPRGYAPALKELTRELIRGIPDGRGRMDAIASHFRGGGYLWSLEGLVLGEDALERFVLDVRRGNCEYFASAAGVMLRMAGVPARLVAGYRGGHYNRSGGYYAVRERQAHVWVEAWDRDARTWVRIDPTPAGSAEGAGETGILGGWWDFWDYLDYQWNSRFVGYNARTQSEWASFLRDLLRNPRASLRAPSGGLGGLRSVLVGGALWLVLPLSGLWLIGTFLRRRRRDPCRVLLERFDRAMRKHGADRRNAEGLEEFVSRLNGPLRRLAEQFVSDFEEVWYGGRPLDPERRERLERRLADLGRLKRDEH